MSQPFSTNREMYNIDQVTGDFKRVVPLKLPVTRITSKSEAYKYNSVPFYVDGSLLDSLKTLADDHQVEVSTLFLASFLVVLQRYSGQEDVFLGNLGKTIIEENDEAAEVVDTVNSIRTQFNNNISFTALARQLQNQLADGGHFIINNLAKTLSNAGLDINIFLELFAFNKNEESAGRLGLSLEEIKSSLENFSGFLIGCFLNETSSGVEGSVVYGHGSFTESFAKGFANHFIVLLQAVVNNSEKAVGAYNILTEAEQHQIVIKFNDTVADYPKHQTINNLFEEQVVNLPDHVALSKGTKTITYSELDKQANRLARLLIKSGVSPQDNVGLLVTRDFEMIIGMLAIMKAGAAYVPIDPDYPIERQEYIYNQSLLKMVIADKDYPLKSLIDETNFLKINFKELNRFEGTNPGIKADGSQLAYTIYTSGSTGRPKGVMIEHHSAVNLILWVNQQFNISPADRLLFITSMCFDLSVYDIFGILAAGGTVVIAEQREIQNVQSLQKMLVDHKITFWDSVPTTLDYLVKNLELENQQYNYAGLKTIFMSGDWIPVDLPDRIKQFFPESNVVSLGGATEGTVWSNFFPVEVTKKEWNSIPYGRPIMNNFFYILNEHLQPVPINVPGDLYIGGVGVARGYANDPDKTNAAFVTDPFNSGLGGMMYKTGDLGKMLPDMNMEFIGRKDNQVKIQGFRIELGEIESVLNGFELISNAVVLAKDDQDGKKRLVGYIVPKVKFERGALVSYLKTKLPEYMVPAVWIEMNGLPLTSNGKIDRKSLPEVESKTAVPNDFSEPLTTTEKILIDIWKQCMGLDVLSINDNFFELGGHSLLAVQILSKIQKKTGRSYQLAILFKHPDVRSLAHYIDNEIDDHEYSSLVPIKPSGSKTPLYIVHGEGLNVLNFSGLAACIDEDQPIFGFQAKGLNGVDEPLDNMTAIAKHYVDEMIMHNPTGPYLLAGYSFGGYVAVEMQKQMAAIGKEIKMLIMFDTNAEKTEYKDWYALLPKKVKRNFPKLLLFLKSSIYQPITTFKDQTEFISKKLTIAKKDTRLFYQQLKKIKEKHLFAFRNYKMTPFDDKVYLFKAKICVHYVNDPLFLGWKKYASKGVELLDVPGDHLSMFSSPNVQQLALALQKALDQHSHY